MKMKSIKKGIVFSNDIERILKGVNAFDYKYGVIPNKGVIESIRNDFRLEVNKIFNNKVTIITEEEMDLVNNLITGDYPHCNIR